MPAVLYLIRKLVSAFGKIPPGARVWLGRGVVAIGIYALGFYVGGRRCDPAHLAAQTAKTQHPTLPGTAIVTKRVPPDTVFVTVFKAAKAVGGKVVAGATASIPGGVQVAKPDTVYVTAAKERVQTLSDSSEWGVLRGVVRAPASVDSALDVRLTYTRASLRPVFSVIRSKDSTYVTVGGLPGIATEVRGFADVHLPPPRLQRTALVGYSAQGPALGLTVSLRLAGPLELHGIGLAAGRRVTDATGIAAAGIAWRW